MGKCILFKSWAVNVDWPQSRPHGVTPTPTQSSLNLTWLQALPFFVINKKKSRGFWHCRVRFIDRRINWLIDLFIQLWTDGLSHWLIDWGMDWLIDWLIVGLIDWLIDSAFLPHFSFLCRCPGEEEMADVILEDVIMSTVSELRNVQRPARTPAQVARIATWSTERIAVKLREKGHSLYAEAITKHVSVFHV